MTCDNCGWTLPENMNYCCYCGAAQREIINVPAEPQRMQTAYVPPAQSVPQPAVVYAMPVVQKTNSGTGIAALVLGIIGLFTWIIWVPSILAVILGFVGIVSADKDHTCGCAIAGLVLGLIIFIPSLCILLLAA